MILNGKDAGQICLHDLEKLVTLETSLKGKVACGFNVILNEEQFVSAVPSLSCNNCDSASNSAYTPITDDSNSYGCFNFININYM